MRRRSATTPILQRQKLEPLTSCGHALLFTIVTPQARNTPHADWRETLPLTPKRRFNLKTQRGEYMSKAVRTLENDLTTVRVEDPKWCGRCTIRVAPHEDQKTWRGKTYHRSCFKKLAIERVQEIKKRRESRKAVSVRKPQTDSGDRIRVHLPRFAS